MLIKIIDVARNSFMI